MSQLLFSAFLGCILTATASAQFFGTNIIPAGLGQRPTGNGNAGDPNRPTFSPFQYFSGSLANFGQGGNPFNLAGVPINSTSNPFGIALNALNSYFNSIYNQSGSVRPNGTRSNQNQDKQPIYTTLPFNPTNPQITPVEVGQVVQENANAPAPSNQQDEGLKKFPLTGDGSVNLFNFNRTWNLFTVTG